METWKQIWSDLDRGGNKIMVVWWNFDYSSCWDCFNVGWATDTKQISDVLWVLNEANTRGNKDAQFTTWSIVVQRSRQSARTWPETAEIRTISRKEHQPCIKALSAFSTVTGQPTHAVFLTEKDAVLTWLKSGQVTNVPAKIFFLLSGSLKLNIKWLN